MRVSSLGLIETWGYVAAIEAADVGLKAANVDLMGCEITKTALVTIKFSGDVGAVKAAVDAGKIAAEKVGRVIAAHVIPRPNIQDLNSSSVPDLLSSNQKITEEKEPVKIPEKEPVKIPEKEPGDELKDIKEVARKARSKRDDKKVESKLDNSPSKSSLDTEKKEEKPTRTKQPAKKIKSKKKRKKTK